jgi:lipopolysaccharide transport system ATP-binding protein
MANDVVIQVEGLGKKYVISHLARRERYVALRDVLARSARNLGRSAVDLLRGRPMLAGDEAEEFWALRNISFEVRRGEVLGIVGRNGAGKSTLLKILSRITEPSEGRVIIAGRVASLLEVGTGFHPELTGRENIYLNGAILGMSRREIKSKFEDIVAFAEIDKFLDTPVKRYSTGMYVRLAFAVAAHLEPEILIVDEVLAVGDFQFQQKCLGKMSEVAHGGRTVLFVSHNIGALADLCDRCAVLDRGSLVTEDETHPAIHRYLSLTAPTTHLQYRASNAASSQPAQLIEADLHGSNTVSENTIPFRQDFWVRMKWKFSVDAPGASIALRFYNSLGQLVTAVNTIGRDLKATTDSTIDIACELENRFVPGTYYIAIACHILPHTTLAEFERYLSFVVSDLGESETFKIANEASFAALAHWRGI